MATKSEKELKKIRILAEIRDLKKIKNGKWRKKKSFNSALVNAMVGLFLFSIFMMNKSFWTDLTTSNHQFILVGSAGMLITVIFFFNKKRKANEEYQLVYKRIGKKYGELKRLG